ncbi:MAG: hypothetical protein IKE34_12550 [Paenibacillus sp.]|nr:hypothetical protein [Paenibacillus sp.]
MTRLIQRLFRFAYRWLYKHDETIAISWDMDDDWYVYERNPERAMEVWIRKKQ